MLTNMLVDGAIGTAVGTAVGTGIGALAQLALVAANVTLFIASPLVAPLVMLGWGATALGHLSAAQLAPKLVSNTRTAGFRTCWLMRSQVGRLCWLRKRGRSRKPPLRGILSALRLANIRMWSRPFERHVAAGPSASSRRLPIY